MRILADISFYADENLQSVDEIYMEVTGYASYLQNYEAHIIRHLAKVGYKHKNGVHFHAFRSKNNYFHLPWKTLKFLRKIEPEVIIVQGFSHPIQTIYLRLLPGKKPLILLQDRAGAPARFPKRLLHQWADSCVNGYLFTNEKLAKPWLQKNIISNKNKCFSLPGAYTNFTAKNKTESRQKLGFQGEYNFLWVGRLNENKDPITVLKVFEKFLQNNSSARLYMIYQENDLENEILKLFDENEQLKNAVQLVGKIPHNELEYWYSAADFYISASHRESTGFTLLEALSCGCIPIVSHIASYQKMLEGCEAAYFFEPGNDSELLQIFQLLSQTEREKASRQIKEHFQEHLSFAAEAKKLEDIILQLQE